MVNYCRKIEELTLDMIEQNKLTIKIEIENQKIINNSKEIFNDEEINFIALFT